jgi:hypothetical protein
VHSNTDFPVGGAVRIRSANVASRQSLDSERFAWMSGSKDPHEPDDEKAKGDEYHGHDEKNNCGIRRWLSIIVVHVVSHA